MPKMKHNFSNPIMVFIISFSCFLLVSSNGSEKDFNCRYVGNLIGWDATRCGCCGGWKIEIEGQYFLADSIPNKRQVLSPKDTIFPIPVFIDYRKEEFCNNRIIITSIKKK